MTTTNPAGRGAGSGILPLAAATDPAACGGKAANLGRALRAGLPVPDGVVLTPSAVRRISTGDGAVDCGHLTALLGAMAPPGTRFAVRSSAVDEDGATASFAGQYVTRLGVRCTPGALRAAITAVHSSLTAPSAIDYRTRIGDGRNGSAAMAVLIQPLIDADAAGVLFTRNPITGADERVIEATIGLGESVVAGLVTPDLYRLAPDGTLLERRNGIKRITVRSAARGGTEELEVDAARARAPCLDDAALTRLHQLAVGCGEIFGPAPLDIEWAIGGSTLHLLQCRRIRHAHPASSVATRT